MRRTRGVRARRDWDRTGGDARGVRDGGRDGVRRDGRRSPDAGHGSYTVFDNEAAGTGNTGTGVTSELSRSRAITVRLDPGRRIATLVQSDDQPQGVLASSQGNAQRLRDGGLFVGWGALPEFSQFSRSGRLVFDATYPTGYISYRAYRLPWGEPRHRHG